MKIEEIIAEKESKTITGTYVISEIALRPFTEKEGSFLTFILQDNTGRVQGKIWDDVESFKIKDESVVTISGKINLFRGKNQVIVESAKVETEYNIADFLPTSIINVNSMFDEFCSIMNSIQNPILKTILDSYLNDKQFIEQFKLCPGGKGDVHHAYLHGLLEHTLSVIKICDFYSTHFKDVNRDILLMGAFLHDLGKIQAYEYKIAIKMTDIGRLHGHTSLSYFSFLDQVNAIQIENQIEVEELKKVLGHMILSHHGTLDRGASIVPMIREAVLLVEADGTDADMAHITKLLETTKDSWTQWDSLRGRMYYQKQEKEEKAVEEKPKITRKKSSSPLFKYDEKI